MAKRFFKLLYILALIGIVISLPVYLLDTIQFDKIVISSYKAKCNSNNQYVILEGNKLDEPYIFDEIFLNDTTYGNVKKSLNFNCQYYDQIQPFVVAYTESKTREDQINVNKAYFNFEEANLSNVYIDVPSYKLEEVSTETNWYEVSGPIIDWLGYAILTFAILQAIRICYMYVVYNEIVWHPFKHLKK